MSLKEDSHERAASLFEAARGRPGLNDWFHFFVDGFFKRYSPEKDNMPLKRFLTLHGEEFGRKHPATFETICERLVLNLKWRLDSLASQKLLIDLVGQHSLLTPVAFAEGFLHTANDIQRANFIKYGYREALEEGLTRRKYLGGRMYLWDLMVSTLPNQFSGKFPKTDKARAAALRSFKHTKQDREEAWIMANAQNPQTMLRMKQLAKYLNELEINFPTVLWVIVAEYAIVPSWIDTD